MLYPRESETREVKSLAGIWNFQADTSWLERKGRRENWQENPLVQPVPMPVPASYNDLTQDTDLRDHVGDVWYERTFFVPAAWSGRKIVLRFGSATHHAVAWLNGTEVCRHKGGFLPFEADISALATPGTENRLTVVVDNVLDRTCLPPGAILNVEAPGMDPIPAQDIQFDFFNYGGIHRDVRLLCLPFAHVDNLRLVPGLHGDTGLLDYEVGIAGQRVAGIGSGSSAHSIEVRLLDAEGREVAHAQGANGRLEVSKVRLWEPGNAYLYTFEARLLDAQGGLLDVYREPTGIRTVEVTATQFLINGKPFYFRGFGKHEDAELRGRAHDPVTLVKDFTLLKWIGANSFRTSHYPYDEEVLYFADREGIVVIDEAPAVGMFVFNKDTGKSLFDGSAEEAAMLRHHLDVMDELVARDRNHPSVVMWSVSNEPETRDEGSEKYFGAVIRHTRQLDPTRPVTLVTHMEVHNDRVAALLDVICFNRYPSWYTHAGRLEVVEPLIHHEIAGWHAKHGKPVMVTEYGTDTLAGVHLDPPGMFSEEYQVEFLRRISSAFDRSEALVGEHVWNFADFRTKQGLLRVEGNKKGIFTRQRQPKAAAHFLRERWHKLGGTGY